MGEQHKRVRFCFGGDAVEMALMLLAMINSRLGLEREMSSNYELKTMKRIDCDVCKCKHHGPRSRHMMLAESKSIFPHRNFTLTI